VRECTHLIVNRIARTEKFLCAMAVSPFIVSEEWAKACASQKQILGMLSVFFHLTAHSRLSESSDAGSEEYRLHDRTTEDKYHFKLSDALRRAKENEGQLFSGMTFYVTQKVGASIDFKLLKNVTVAHGGQVRFPSSPERQTNPTLVLDQATESYTPCT